LLVILDIEASIRFYTCRIFPLEDRLVFDENRESNVEFLMPYEQVVEMWRRCN
jgi:hypothetical protein